MKNKELVSIVVPVYNVKDYLAECLDSILAQTYQQLEILLVDDGSTDGCATICDDYAGKDRRIRVIHQSNGGLSNARNTGIELSSGSFLMFVDSDDLIAPSIVEHLLSVLSSKHAGIAICDPLHVYSTPLSLEGIPSSGIRVFAPEEAICEMWYQTSFLPSAWGKLYRKELFDSIRFREGICYEDIDLMHLLFEKAGTIAYSGAKLYFYRHRSGSITQTPYSEKDCEQLAISRKLQNYADGRSAAMRRAANAYAVTCAFRVLLNAPQTQVYRLMIEQARSQIRRYSLSVLTDRHVRRKTRLALLMYPLPMRVVRSVYSHVNRWKG